MTPSHPSLIRLVEMELASPSARVSSRQFRPEWHVHRTNFMQKYKALRAEGEDRDDSLRPGRPVRTAS